jgi:pyruvate,orthophosphate dikinase
LNLGLNDETVQGLSVNFGERFAMDSYRRFLNMFGTVVMNIPHHSFEHVMDNLKKSVGAKDDGDLNTDHLAQLVEEYKQVYVAHGIYLETIVFVISTWHLTYLYSFGDLTPNRSCLPERPI